MLMLAESDKKMAMQWGWVERRAHGNTGLAERKIDQWQIATRDWQSERLINGK
jgi:hypothetical protein